MCVGGVMELCVDFGAKRVEYNNGVTRWFGQL